MREVDIGTSGIVGSRQLAKLIGIDLSTLCQWCKENAKLRACRIRRGIYSIRELRAAGYLNDTK